MYPTERTALADYLSCHEEARAAARAAAWAAGAAGLNQADWDQAEYWLDVEFIEFCPGHQVWTIEKATRKPL